MICDSYNDDSNNLYKYFVKTVVESLLLAFKFINFKYFHGNMLSNWEKWCYAVVV